MSHNQRQGVYVTVMNYFADQGVGFDDGQTPTATDLLKKEDRRKVIELICFGLLSNEIEMSTSSRVKYSTEEAMMKYSGELLSNWLRKDERLNGNTKYQPANPGSRAGAGDSMIKELKKLRQVQEQAGNEEALAMIDEAIAARQAEIGATKVKKIEVDADKIPAHLQHLVK